MHVLDYSGFSPFCNSFRDRLCEISICGDCKLPVFVLNIEAAFNRHPKSIVTQSYLYMYYYYL